MNLMARKDKFCCLLGRLEFFFFLMILQKKSWNILKNFWQYKCTYLKSENCGYYLKYFAIIKGQCLIKKKEHDLTRKR